MGSPDNLQWSLYILDPSEHLGKKTGHDVLCYFVLYSLLLCGIALFYAMLWFIIKCYGMVSLYGLLWYVMELLCVMLWSVIKCYGMSWYAI